jgi:ATP-dependent RNA helicase RhlB
MGDLPQTKRLKIIDNIKGGNLRILVATDVAARGLDIEDLSLVINYDLPNESENYVHRIGRTARAGKTGKAITFACEQDVYELPGIERYIGRKINSETVIPEMLEEDKSQGHRIFMDSYENRDSREKGTRGRRRGYEDDRERQGRRDKRKDSISPKERPGRDRPAKGKKPEQAAMPGKKREFSGADRMANAGADPMLSRLSLGERMAYYKQKYDKSAGGTRRGKTQKPPRRDQGAVQSRSNDRENALDKNRSKDQSKARDRKPEQNRKRARSRPNDIKQPQSEKTPVIPTVSPAPAAEKKGLLSKLAGLFRKPPENKT